MLRTDHLVQPNLPRSVTLHSDRTLVSRILQGDKFAFGQVYDRYAPLVWTLASHADAGAAPAVLETVFVELWRDGQSAPVPLPLGRFLVECVTQNFPMTFSNTDPLRRDGLSGDVVSLLRLFESLDPFVRDVFTLVRLGSLKVPEISIALEVESTVILRMLSTGLRLLSKTPQINTSMSARDKGDAFQRVPHET
jgi:hypothetical protein